jgi:hypothetical protein
MAKEKATRVKSALGGKKDPGKKGGKKSGKKDGKKQVHRMHISKTDNGKFLVEHEFKPGEDGSVIPNERHALNPEELQGHLQDNMELPPEEMMGAAGAPAAAPAGPPMPAARPPIPMGA